MKRLSGIIPPLVTPVNQDGSLDNESLEKIINNCIEHGCNGIFIMGSCGEGSVMGSALRKELTQKAVSAVNARVPLLVGVLENSTQKVIEEIKRLETCGAEYFVVTAPYYLAVSGQEEIYRHFKAVAESTDKMIVVYNIPCFVHCDILPETMRKLCMIKNIVGVKDSTGSWDLFQRALMLKKTQDFNLLSGDENLCAAGMLFGADGCVPCLANAYPSTLVDLYKAATEKDVERVFHLETRLVNTKKVWGCGGYWIAIVKYLCARKGLCKEYTLTPSENLTDAQKKFIDDLLDAREEMY